MSTVQKPRVAASIALSDSAAEQVKLFMNQQGVEMDTAGLRVSAAPGGCSGFRYWLNVEEHPLPDDSVMEQDGLRVFLDAVSAQCLAGATIDFVSNGETSGFKVSNPNEPSSCSCDCSQECPT